MEGAEHYREAEILLSGADPQGNARRVTTDDIARALVHATLAQAAAQVAPLVHQMCGDSSRVTDWGRVINWDTVPEAKAFRDRIVNALAAGRVVDLRDVTDWQRGYRACWERIRPLLDPTGDLLREVLDEEVPF